MDLVTILWSWVLLVFLFYTCHSVLIAVLSFVVGAHAARLLLNCVIWNFLIWVISCLGLPFEILLVLTLDFWFAWWLWQIRLLMLREAFVLIFILGFLLSEQILIIKLWHYIAWSSKLSVALLTYWEISIVLIEVIISVLHVLMKINLLYFGRRLVLFNLFAS